MSIQGKMHSSNSQFELSKNKLFPTKWIFFQSFVRKSGQAIKNSVSGVRQNFGGVFYDIFQIKDELTFKTVFVQGT